MSAQFGIPYMGSKNKILKNICAIFPKADHFYDLFGGGFSVTHFMLTHRRNDYKHFHFNEIKKGIPELIQDAIAGKYNYNVFKPEFIDRKTFLSEKEKNQYIKTCWSFGNNGRDYIFSKEIEPYKKSMHNAIVFNLFNDLAKEVLQMDKFKDGFSIKDKRLFLRNKIEYYRKNGIPKILHQFLNEKQLQRLERLERLQRLRQLQQLKELQQLERLERLQRLERLEQLSKLNFYNTDYRKVEIKENSIVYCDIPYEDTASYDGGFDYKSFYNWAHEIDKPVFISEFNIDDKRFRCIWKKKKRSLMNGASTKVHPVEKVYVNDYAYKMLLKNKLQGSKS